MPKICAKMEPGALRAPIPPRIGWLGKISTESRSTHGTFFFLPRYCRGQKVDPT
jgi:hypothetical protein